MTQNSIGAPVSPFGKTLIDDVDQPTAVGTLFDNAALTPTTIAPDDLVIIQDSSNGKVARTCTAQDLADLSGGGAAPVNATYITQTPSVDLTDEQALSLLTTGIMKSTTTTGVVSIAVEGTDYYAPGGVDVAIADGGTGASTNTDGINNLVSGASLTSATIASGDLILIQDISDANNLKSVTAQSIADLGPGGSAAPGDSTYIIQVADVNLPNAQDLSSLSTGLLKSTTTTGVISIAVPDTDYLDANATLISIGLLGTAADKTIYTTGVDTWAETGLTAAGRALIDDATASDQRTTLGLGTIATQNSNAVSITGGSITGITDLLVSDGGSGVSSFSPYSVICGGTTSTGPLQSVASTGVSGQFLTSQGAGALPIWTSGGGGGGGSGAQFWAQVDGTGTTILSSFNVSSILDQATGQLAVYFTVPFASSNWCATLTSQIAAGGDVFCTMISSTNPTVVAGIVRRASGAFADPGAWFFAGFGAQ